MVFLESYHIATSVMALLSLFACFWMMKTYFDTEEKNIHTPLKIIYLISVALAFQSINFLAWAFLADSDLKCIIVESIQTFTEWLTLFWSLTLAIISYRTITWMGRFDAQSYFNRSKIYIILISLVMAVVPALGIAGLKEVYFPDENYCGILDTQSESTMIQVIVKSIELLVPMFLCLIVTVVCWVSQKRFIRRKFSSLVLARSKIKNEKLYWYPTAQLIAGLPKAIDVFFYVAGQSGEGYYIFGFIAFLLWGSAGLLNTLTYEWLHFRLKPKRKNRATLLSMQIESGTTSHRKSLEPSDKNNLRDSLLGSPKSGGGGDIDDQKNDDDDERFQFQNSYEESTIL